VSDQPQPRQSNVLLIVLIVAAVLAVPALCVCGGVASVLLYRFAAQPPAPPQPGYAAAPTPARR